jgi:hypothetical protein
VLPLTGHTSLLNESELSMARDTVRLQEVLVALVVPRVVDLCPIEVR